MSINSKIMNRTLKSKVLIHLKTIFRRVEWWPHWMT